MENKNKWLLGKDVNGDNVYLQDFSFDCGWYWGGGYIKVYSKGRWVEHSHFSQFNTDYKTERGCDLHTGFLSRIVEPVLSDDEIWRLCDLMNQFYAHQESAECFKCGGHYTSKGRTKKEINMSLNKRINKHIETVIIPEVRKIFKK